MIEVLYFSGEHCSVCKALKPKLLPKIADLYPEVEVRVIDVVEEQEFAAQHLVFTLPVVLILVEYKEQFRFVRSFSVQEVLDKLERLKSLIQRK